MSLPPAFHFPFQWTSNIILSEYPPPFTPIQLAPCHNVIPCILYLLWRAKTLHHNTQSSAWLNPQDPVQVIPTQVCYTETLICCISLSCRWCVHIKIFEQCWWCVRGRWEGGQQCSVTASWWCCLGAYTFVGCKLHCCILTLLTHHQNHALTNWNYYIWITFVLVLMLLTKRSVKATWSFT